MDLVVHGGDLFHRSRIPPSLAYQAFQPMLEAARAGIPVFLVPGNHERSRIPHAHLSAHPDIHIFHEPRTFPVAIAGQRVALSGFPFQLQGVRNRFPGLVERTGWREVPADLRLLCVHHCVEGATVGPSGFTFRGTPDVIRARDIPGNGSSFGKGKPQTRGFSAVLAGHIHRGQVLATDLGGKPLRTPVYYPGSVERTAFAEAGEEKGFILIEAQADPWGGRILGHEVLGLPTRPMEVVTLSPPGGPAGAWVPERLQSHLGQALLKVQEGAVLQIRVRGRIPPEARVFLTAHSLRGWAPGEMNVHLILEEDRTGGRRIGPGEGRVPGRAKGPRGREASPGLRSSRKIMPEEITREEAQLRLSLP